MLLFSFYRAWRQPKVVASSFDWLTGLCVSFVAELGWLVWLLFHDTHLKVAQKENRPKVRHKTNNESILTPSRHIINGNGVVMSVIALNILEANLEVCCCNALIK